MSEGQSITVMYVDDEEINLFLFEATFSKKYKVITATSGPAGLDKLKDHHEEVKVVISDMNMPEMNGIQFVTEASKNYQNINFFILTGYNYNEEIDEAIKANLVQRFFSKPFNENELETAINDVA